MHSCRRSYIVVLAAAAVVVAWSPATSTQTRQQQTVTRLEVGPGSKAVYRVREQLARLNFPNDAVGETQGVTGAIEVRSDGTFTTGSKLTVDLRTIRSDEGRRDAYVRENTFETDRYPLAEFVPRSHKGMPVPLPASGSATFQLIGDMTLHGVTSQTAWNVAASFTAGTVTVRATTRINFATFKLTPPRVFAVLSIEDDIRLELDVSLRRM